MNSKQFIRRTLQLMLWATLFIPAVLLRVPAAEKPAADPVGGDSPKAIFWTELVATAEARYSGEGLRITPTEHGAWMHCVFQRLDGEATREGLGLTSTLSDQPKDRFRVKAVAVGRSDTASSPPVVPQQVRSGLRLPSDAPQMLTHSVTLPITGDISVHGQTVRFTRPGLVEEYGVGMDGVRQDFVVLDQPPLPSASPRRDERTAQPAVQTTPTLGELRVELSVTGALVVQTANGVQLVLDQSGRKIAYSRLEVTDANGKKLSARMEVANKSEIRESKCEIRLAVVVDDADAVYPVRIDPTFSDANWISLGGIPGANGGVFAAVVDGAGNLYVGGDFTVIGDSIANRVAKWNGSAWLGLGSGIDAVVGLNPANVRALAVFGGDVYAGGSFTTAGGIAANNIAKWDGNAWCAMGSGVNDVVHSLAVLGQDIYAGGRFTMASGISANYIAKWNGIAWSALSSGVSSGFGDTYVAALVACGSDMYAAGNFTTAGGSAANNIARWDGNTWSPLGSGLDSSDGQYPVVHALAASERDLYAGGSFKMADGLPATYIAKWNGSAWSPVGLGVNNTVLALTLSGSDLYVGGHFTTAGNNQANHIAIWDGNAWSSLGSGVNNAVSALAIWGGSVYVGGGTDGANNISKWNGSTWSAFGSGLNNRVLALAVTSEDIYAGGDFTTAGADAANYIAKWNGSSWSALGLGMNDTVSALVASGSDVYAGGWFTTAGGSAANYIARWNGRTWSALGSGMNGSVEALAVSGSNLYAGGRFSIADGKTANRIAKWNGSIWSALNLGMDGPVYSLAVLGNDVYVGGDFVKAGSTFVYRIAKWNGSAWSALGTGMSGRVSALAVSGSDLYAGGLFTTAGGSAAKYTAKWNGSSWSALGLGMNNTVSALVASGSNVYAGGYFTTAGGGAANYIAKWNGSAWSALGSGMNGSVEALALSGSEMYAGGALTTAGGKVSGYAAKAIMADAPGYNLITCSPLPEGSMQFSYVGYPATNYALDRAFNLAPPIHWDPQETNAMSTSGVLSFTNTPAPGTNNFWRVRSVL